MVAMPSRNSPKGQACRQWMNFLVLERAHGKDPAKVHIVWALVSSLLGLVVIPHERGLVAPDSGPDLEELERRGWPSWNIERDTYQKKTQTLGRLIEHIRNAVAHGRITFEPEDARCLSGTMLKVEDRRNEKRRPVEWRAQIDCAQLETFCSKLVDSLDAAPGSGNQANDPPSC